MGATPALRKSLEAFLLAVKSMLNKNNLLAGWEVGNLKAKRVDGTVLEKEDDPIVDYDDDDDEDENDDVGARGDETKSGAARKQQTISSNPGKVKMEVEEA